MKLILLPSVLFTRNIFGSWLFADGILCRVLYELFEKKEKILHIVQSVALGVCFSIFLVLYCEFCISIYARLCPSTARIQLGLYSYIIISSKPIVENSKGTFTVFPKQMCLLTKSSYQKGVPAVIYDHTVVWYSSHTHHGDWRSTITSVRCRQIDIYFR